MPVKKTTAQPPATNVNNNTNNNTNNVNVHVKVEHPKAPRKAASNKKEKPNWWTRTLIGGIIALILSVAGYYATNGWGKVHNARIENTPLIERDRK